MSDAANLVNKLWSCCNVLRDDRPFCGDYLEQLMCLLFLMSDAAAGWAPETLKPAREGRLRTVSSKGQGGNWLLRKVASGCESVKIPFLDPQPVCDP